MVSLLRSEGGASGGDDDSCRCGGASRLDASRLYAVEYAVSTACGLAKAADGLANKPEGTDSGANGDLSQR
jgi:hypothetical protein